MTDQEQLRFATRVARRLSRDPEALSVAGEAVLHARHTWRAERGVSLQWWIALAVKSRVGSYARMRACRPLELVDPTRLAAADQWEDLKSSDADLRLLDEDREDEGFDPDDFQLLTARYVEGQAEWSIARELGVTEYEARKRIAAAKARFLRFMGV